MTSIDLTETYHTVMPATKIDLVREFRELYIPGREPASVEVPQFSFLMVDGHGDPNVAPEHGRARAG
jgi:hypothetical protein